MNHPSPKAVFRKNYAEPPYQVERVDLRFDLREEKSTVFAQWDFRRRKISGSSHDKRLVLNGEGLELISIKLDGRELSAQEFHLDNGNLTIEEVPDAFQLETTVSIRPQNNTELSGLYKSSGNFCTQCEAEGFRRITYALDRPDVMTRFTTTIVADRKKYPILLSNGNRVADGAFDDGRHWVKWEDPFKKPSYLFALVAGDLRCHSGEFKTVSGRIIRLEIWVEPQNIDMCDHALCSLQRAMKWDEEVFGLEYDLDIYMIVAVSDFNMGAMENKGLNIFNSKYVLACPATATDNDYEQVEAVIAHEYFHNWTGNRVTCRDWFQLTLKEGLTVFRDQMFTADMTSASVKRINDVRALRIAQFAEDAGPMTHPIRPESYIAMDNFYTTTVYEKGAEVIRMYHTLLGTDGFRRGMDLYIERHDGQAVTCDDFRAAMADANKRDLTQFEQWYVQSGTPILKVRGEYDRQSKSYALTFEQVAPEGSNDPERPPLPIPVAIGLLGKEGRDLPLQLQDEEAPSNDKTRIFQIKEKISTFSFQQIDHPPVPSILRGFSAPVKIRMDRDRRELAFLMAHDSDSFNRWDAGQTLAMEILIEMTRSWDPNNKPDIDPLISEAFGRILSDKSLDGSMKAQALMLPTEGQMAQEMSSVDPDAIHAAREHLIDGLAGAHLPALTKIYHDHASVGPYTKDQSAIHRRRLRNTALRYLTTQPSQVFVSLAFKQFNESDNMTDSQSALFLLADMDCPERDQALQAFYTQWNKDPLVIDKWFSVQAGSKRRDALAQVMALTKHPDFTWKNPNRLRALIGAFCMSNHVRFHQSDGAGYAFLGDVVLRLNKLNPQITARLASGFNQWRRYDAGRQAKIRAQLERILAHEGLSKDVFEVVSRALGNDPK